MKVAIWAMASLLAALIGDSREGLGETLPENSAAARILSVKASKRAR